jgi:hypothetical protein
MKKNNVVIVIPIHKVEPTRYELISFQQCFKIFSSSAIKLVAPQNLSLEIYKSVVPGLETIFIEPFWQTSIVNYNKLKISRFFYRLFKDYEYLLTYELDAFVFRNDLDYWCEQAYDYIGAPWFEDYLTANSGNSTRLFKVGNSGFSLRNIQSVRKVLNDFYYQMPWEFKSGTENFIKAIAKTPYRWLKNQGSENFTLQAYYNKNEDQFFSETVPQKFKDFKIAPVEEALKFSFEVKPEYLFQLNNNQLPMGCHAWWRYNLEFWKPHIESFGYRL